MNVGELKQLLRHVPDDTQILLASDPEGNGFRPLVDVEDGLIRPNEDKHGYVEDLIDPDEVDEDEEDNLEARVVFWP